MGPRMTRDPRASRVPMAKVAVSGQQRGHQREQKAASGTGR